MDDDQTLCPSARCEDGAILLGVIQPNGQVAYFGHSIGEGALVVDEEFAERARRGRAPEKRFRFASACVECGCKQWTGTRCGVIDRVLDLAEEEDATAALPRCGIRPRCRWFQQSGPDACAVCPLIVTDTTEPPA